MLFEICRLVIRNSVQEMVSAGSGLQNGEKD